MTDERIDEYRRNILEIISALDREYMRAKKPYLDELVKLESMRTSTRIQVSVEQFALIQQPLSGGRKVAK